MKSFTVYVENLGSHEMAGIDMPTSTETIIYFISQLTGGRVDYDIADVVISDDRFGSDMVRELCTKSLDEVNEVAGYIAELDDWERLEFSSLFDVYGNLYDVIDIHSEADYTMISDVSEESELGAAAIELGYFGDIPTHLEAYIDHAAIGRDMTLSGEWSITRHGTAVSTLR